jgi:hypothetical protein
MLDDILASSENLPNTLVRRGNLGEFSGLFQGECPVDNIQVGLKIVTEDFVTDNITRVYLIDASENDIIISINTTLSNRSFIFKRIDNSGYIVTIDNTIDNLVSQVLNDYDSIKILLYNSNLYIMNWYKA